VDGQCTVCDSARENMMLCAHEPRFSRNIKEMAGNGSWIESNHMLHVAKGVCSLSHNGWVIKLKISGCLHDRCRYPSWGSPKKRVSFTLFVMMTMDQL
jgi:hypothetical protein